MIVAGKFLGNGDIQTTAVKNNLEKLFAIIAEIALAIASLLATTVIIVAASTTVTILVATHYLAITLIVAIIPVTPTATTVATQENATQRITFLPATELILLTVATFGAVAFWGCLVFSKKFSPNKKGCYGK